MHLARARTLCRYARQHDCSVWTAGLGAVHLRHWLVEIRSAVSVEQDQLAKAADRTVMLTRPNHALGLGLVLAQRHGTAVAIAELPGRYAPAAHRADGGPTPALVEDLRRGVSRRLGRQGAGRLTVAGGPPLIDRVQVKRHCRWIGRRETACNQLGELHFELSLPHRRKEVSQLGH